MSRRSHIGDGEEATLAGVAASPSGPPPGPTATILKFPDRTAAFVGVGEVVAAIVMRLIGGRFIVIERQSEDGVEPDHSDCR